MLKVLLCSRGGAAVVGVVVLASLFDIALLVMTDRMNAVRERTNDSVRRDLGRASAASVLGPGMHRGRRSGRAVRTDGGGAWDAMTASQDPQPPSRPTPSPVPVGTIRIPRRLGLLTGLVTFALVIVLLPMLLLLVGGVARVHIMTLPLDRAEA